MLCAQMELSMPGVLGILVGLAKDLRHDFAENLPQVLEALTQLLSSGGDKVPIFYQVLETRKIRPIFGVAKCIPQRCSLVDTGSD